MEPCSQISCWWTISAAKRHALSFRLNRAAESSWRVLSRYWFIAPGRLLIAGFDCVLGFEPSHHLPSKRW